MSKSTETIDVQDVQVFDSEGDYSVPTSNSEVTQKEMAEICQVSITTVKSYLKQIQKLFPREILKNSSNRYFGWVLDEVKRYQNACGGYKVVAGELVQNAEKIDFETYKIRRNIRPEPVTQVIEPDEEFDSSMSITLPDYARSLSAESQVRNDVAVQDSFEIVSSLVKHVSKGLGSQLGQMMADNVLVTANETYNKGVKRGLQHMVNEQVRAIES